MNSSEMPSFNFQLSFSGEVGAAFQEVSGLTEELETEAPLDSFHVLPKRKLYSNLVLKRGVIARNSPFAAWCQRTLENGLSASITTHDVSVALMNEQGERMMQWNFYNAWPVKWSIAGFEGDEISVEVIEMSYTAFDRSY